MNFVITLLSSVAASTALTGVLAWLLQNWISERLKNSIKHEYDLKLESHKSQLQASVTAEIELQKARLQAENATATERLKAELQIAAAERQIRFSRLHEKVGITVSELYSRLSNLIRAVANYTSMFESPAMGGKEDRRKKVVKAMEDFDEYFKLHKLYLPGPLAEKVKILNDKMFAITRDFMFGVEQGGDERSKNRDTWVDVYNQMESDAKPLFMDLETEFRQMLGVEPATNK